MTIDKSMRGEEGGEGGRGIIIAVSLIFGETIHKGEKNV